MGKTSNCVIGEYTELKPSLEKKGSNESLLALMRHGLSKCSSFCGERCIKGVFFLRTRPAAANSPRSYPIVSASKTTTKVRVGQRSRVKQKPLWQDHFYQGDIIHLIMLHVKSICTKKMKATHGDI